ncbi:hypothetical protein ACP4OV_028893 [Aristida adscensionis]
MHRNPRAALRAAAAAAAAADPRPAASGALPAARRARALLLEPAAAPSAGCGRRALSSAAHYGKKVARAAAAAHRPATSGSLSAGRRSPGTPLEPASAPSAPCGRRAFSSAADYGKEVDEVNRKFAEAREEIEAAMESKETVYFDEEASVARDAANDALAAFDALLARLPPADADSLRRSMGLKMEQLKAELKQLED